MVNNVAACLEDYCEKVKVKQQNTQQFRREVEANFDLLNSKISRTESRIYKVVTGKDIVAVTWVLFFAMCYMLSVQEKSLLRQIKTTNAATTLPETNFLKCYTELHDFLAKAPIGERHEYHSVLYVT